MSYETQPHLQLRSQPLDNGLRFVFDDIADMNVLNVISNKNK